jgi:hypothetical protein
MLCLPLNKSQLVFKQKELFLFYQYFWRFTTGKSCANVSRVRLFGQSFSNEADNQTGTLV